MDSTPIEKMKILGEMVLLDYVMTGRLGIISLPEQLGLSREDTDRFLAGRWNRQVSEEYVISLKCRIASILGIKVNDIEILSEYEKERRRYLPIALKLAYENKNLYLEKNMGFFTQRIMNELKGKSNPGYLRLFLDDFFH